MTPRDETSSLPNRSPAAARFRLTWTLASRLDIAFTILPDAAARKRDPLMNKLSRFAATSLPLIVLVSLALRLTFAWYEERALPPNLVGTVPFLNEVGSIAGSLVAGKGFASVFRSGTGPTAWLTPVYPLFVAGIFRIFGVFTARSFVAVVLLNSLCAAAVCVPLFYAGKRIGGISVAAGAASLWAIFPSAIVMPSEWVWDTSLSALLAATILWATLRLDDSQRLRDWLGYGLLWGFAMMTNPALGSLLPVLLAWAAYRRRDSKPMRSRGPALAVATILLCCLPWTIRNYAAFHRFVPLRSNFPFELWLGNNEALDENSRDVTARVTAFEQARTYAQLGETAFMQRRWESAIEFIRAHPVLELRLFGRRIVATWLGTETPVRDFLKTDSAFIGIVFLSNLFVAIGTVAGAALLACRRNPYAVPVTAFPLIFPCLYYLTHTGLRYRHPIDPILLLLTALAIEFSWTEITATLRTM